VIIDDKKEQKENSKFVKNAVRDEGIRDLIAQHYNDIITEDKVNLQKQNESIALKLYQNNFKEREFFSIRKREKPFEKALSSKDSGEEDE